MKLSVVIPTFNMAALCEMGIIALLRTEAPKEDWEVIVVDDQSTDGTWPMLQRYAALGVKSIMRHGVSGRDRNSGPAKNVGLRAASGKVVAFMDADIAHFADAIAITCDWVQRDAHTRGFLTSSNWLRVRFNWREGPQWEGPYGNNGPMPHAAWLAASRDVFCGIGGYDERFTDYGGEDDDMAARLSRMGLEHMPDKRLLAVHGYTPTPSGSRCKTHQFIKQAHLVNHDMSIYRNIGHEWGNPNPEKDGAKP